jgi:hypothetical protein
MEVGSATSGVLLPASFARPFSIFLGVRRLDSESPQQKPLDGEALALIANLSQRNLGIENRGKRKRLPRRRCPRVSLEIPELPLGGCFLPLSLKFLTVGFYRL